MEKRIVLLCAVIVICFQGAAVKADELSDLKEQLEMQNKLLKKMQERLEQLEVKQAHQEEKVQQQITRVVHQKVEQKQFSALPENMEWVKNIKWSGDLRYRHEQYDVSNDTNDKRRRNRIRARLKLQAKLDENWDAIFRLASGSSDSPTSTNQTLGEGFASKDVWIDLAYAHWHPKSRPGLDMYFGKMSNPFYRVGKNQLIWDGDVTPEGIAASYNYNLTDKDILSLTAGGFWLAERENDEDSGYFGLQGLVKHNFDNGSHFLAGASYYDIGNIDSPSSAISGISAKGNTLTAGNLYRYDYDMLEGFAEYGFAMDEMPVSIYGNYVKNIAATEGADTAYLIGCTLNKAKKPGSWQIGYNYRDVESDAVFAGLNDSDFLLGGTDGKGHAINFKYQVNKNLQAGLTYMMAQRNRNSVSQDVDLLQADLVWKF